MITLLFLSFLSGAVTVISPCILPVLPILLSAGVGKARYRPYGIVAGLVVSFTFFTLALTFLVHATGVSPDFLRYGALVVVAFSGLIMLFPRLSDYFASKTAWVARLGNSIQQKSQTAGNGFLGGCVIGAALGLIWTPCAGPILATITAVVATQAITLSTILLTFAYSLGTALPMFLIMYGGNRIIYSTQFLAKYTELIRKIFGALMVLSACALFFNVDRFVVPFLAQYFPVQKEPDIMKLSKNLQNHRAAPEIVGIESWINSEPLTLASLRGKVILLDFWTYSCINCIRTLPHVKKWHTAYKDAGLVIIGVHTPEFEFEKKLSNVQDAVKSFDITYPVALDNKYATWQNYDNRYWPAHYLIDQQGVIQETHFGEGGYRETEDAIRKLLGLAPLSQKDDHEGALEAKTPETYLGYARAGSYAPELRIQKNARAVYNYTQALAHDMVGLKGAWQINAEYIVSESDDAILEFNVMAKNVYLVMQAAEQKDVTVLLDNKEVNTIPVIKPRMYTLCEIADTRDYHLLTLRVPAGVSLYAFTFG